MVGYSEATFWELPHSTINMLNVTFWPKQPELALMGIKPERRA